MHRVRLCLVVAALLVASVSTTPVEAVPLLPPLRTSPNVELVTNIPGSFAGLVFGGDHAFATGWSTGLTVFDISVPESPRPVGGLPLPHFETEDVDLCGDTLLIASDRGTRDIGAVRMELRHPRVTTASPAPSSSIGTTS